MKSKPKLLLLYIFLSFQANAIYKFADKDFSKQTNRVGFTENKGQVRDQNNKPRPDILFGGTDENFVFHLRNNGISYQLSKVNSWKSLVTKDEEILSQTKDLVKEVPDKITTYRLDIDWIGVNVNAEVVIKKIKPSEAFVNYYSENSPEGIFNVRTYEEVLYQNIYNGIDLKFYQHEGHLKYDYIVCAGADYKKIQLEFKGAEKISINKKGDLIVKTPLGEIIEQAPTVYQNGKLLNSKWKICLGSDKRKNRVSFEIENIDPLREFTIDPLVRSWGTYYGGNGQDWTFSCSANSGGDVFIAGCAGPSSGTIIATSGSYQSTFALGSSDAFLAKFDASGQRQWATYYGGFGSEYGLSCSADAFGNIYMAGLADLNTSSSVFTSPGCYQSAHAGGILDCFLVKFNSLGQRQWGTYYGGPGVENTAFCNVDIFGSVFLGGYSDSNTGIATSGSHQSINAGNYDAFLVKFNSNGVRLWGTYYGGSGTENVVSCSTDAYGNLYMAGWTSSATGTAIATVGSHQPTFAGPSVWGDAFLVKFNSSGIRQWATYYGDVGNDGANSCSIDSLGNIFIAGFTTVDTLSAIATAGSYQINSGGATDAFVAKFDSLGTRLWGTYYGGTGNEEFSSCVTDLFGNIYLVGVTDSSSSAILASPGAHQSSYGGGIHDAILAKFDPNGQRMWGTFYGGAGDDRVFSCSLGPPENVFFAGYTNSISVAGISTLGSHQPVYGGGSLDVFLVKFSCAVPTINAGASDAIICYGKTTTLTANGATTYVWAPGGPGASIVVSPTFEKTYTVTGFDLGGCQNTTTLQIKVKPLPQLFITSSNTLICAGEQSTLAVAGAASYTWNTNQNDSNIVVAPTISTIYSVSGTYGCSNTAVYTQIVNACTGLPDFHGAEHQLTVYPNPSEGVFYVSFKNMGNSTLSLYTVSGEIVFKSIVTDNHSSFDLSLKSQGMYFIELNQDGLISRTKLIKN